MGDRRVAIYSSPPPTVWASHRVKCLDVWSTRAEGWLLSLGLTLSRIVFQRWMVTRDVDLGIFSPHLICICCFLHLWSRPRTLSVTVPYVPKPSRCAMARLSRLHQTVCWLSLSEVATAATVYRVSNFMAADGRGRSLARDTMDRRPWNSVMSPAVLGSSLQSVPLK